MGEIDTKTKETIDSIYKLLESEDVDESYKKCLSEIETNLGELPKDIKRIGQIFFLKGYRISEQHNLKILTLISELKGIDTGDHKS